MRRVIAVLTSACIMAIFTAPVCAELKVRDSVGLGEGFGWFSSNARRLKADVDKYLADAGDVKVEGKPVALIAPHAGYRWSGPTAAYVFKPIVGKSYTRVVVLAPSHRFAFPGGSIAAVDFYRTPLGDVPLDKPACAKLLATDIIQSKASAHAAEHSLQNELPFLQRALKDWKLVPVVIGGGQTDADIRKLAEAIKTVVTPDTLIVVSSDFVHYGGNFGYVPFRTDLKANIRKLDQGAIDRICAADYAGFRDYIRKTRATVCGRNPIMVLLKIFEGRKDVSGTLVRYANSGDFRNDYRHAVSYASIVLTQATPDEKDAPGVVQADKLTEKEQRTLLRLARDQLERAVRNRKNPRTVGIDTRQYVHDLNRRLLARGAVFVTLQNKGKLRGCIGDIIARQPLYISVLRNTVNAAIYDFRFRNNRITEKELPEIDIEISYLTPHKRVKSYKDIVIGKHGILMQKGRRRSVFLPQVAPQQRWDLDATLRHLSMKAGLAPDGYKKDCVFHVFEAHVFGEKQLGMWKKKSRGPGEKP